MISKLYNIINSKTIIEEKKIKVNKLIKLINTSKQMRISYPMKTYYNTVIPLNIFQTWHTKNLPPLMYNSVLKIKFNNPAFTYYLFDDNDCRNFIKNNFDDEILNTYDALIPGAYKADLWRYCVLYIKGGIYLDIKYIPVNKFKFINLTEKEHWVLDIDKIGIYNALIVSKPNNQILLDAINKIVENVKNKYYGESSLHVTGPGLLSDFFTINEKKRMDMYHEFINTLDNRFIYFNNYLVLKSYTGYINECDKNKKIDHYSYLWSIKQIYN